MTTQSGPPKTNHKQRRRWPQGAEWARQDAMSDAKQAAALLRQARKEIDHAIDSGNLPPEIRERLLKATRNQSEALELLERIQRQLTEARIGRED